MRPPHETFFRSVIRVAGLAVGIWGFYLLYGLGRDAAAEFRYYDVWAWAGNFVYLAFIGVIFWVSYATMTLRHPGYLRLVCAVGITCCVWLFIVEPVFDFFFPAQDAEGPTADILLAFAVVLTGIAYFGISNFLIRDFMLGADTAPPRSEASFREGAKVFALICALFVFGYLGRISKPYDDFLSENDSAFVFVLIGQVTIAYLSWKVLSSFFYHLATFFNPPIGHPNRDVAKDNPKVVAQ